MNPTPNKCTQQTETRRRVIRRLSGDTVNVHPQAVGLSPRLAECLTVIAHTIAASGHSPSLDEIAQATGTVAKSSAHRKVQALVDRGYVVKRAQCSRTVILTSAGEAWIKRHTETRAGNSPR